MIDTPEVAGIIRPRLLLQYSLRTLTAAVVAIGSIILCCLRFKEDPWQSRAIYSSTKMYMATIAPNGSAAIMDNDSVLVDIVNRQTRKLPSEASRGGINFSNDGRYFLNHGDSTNSPEVWDAKRLDRQLTIPAAPRIEFSADSTLLLTAHSDCVQVWNLSQKVLVARIGKRWPKPILRLSTSQDCRYLAVICSDTDMFQDPGYVYFFALPSGSLIGEVHYLKFSSSADCKFIEMSGRTLAVIVGTLFQSAEIEPIRCPDIRVMDILSKCKEVAAIDSHPQGVIPEISPDGQRLFLPTYYDLEEYDLSTGKMTKQFHQPAGWIRVFAGGRRLLTSNGVICSIESGETIAPLKVAGRKWPFENALCLGDRDDALVSTSDSALSVWQRHRPEHWWGVAWLPEFWTTIVIVVALIWSVRRDRRTFRTSPSSLRRRCGAPAL